VKIGRRVLVNADKARDAIEARFTVETIDS
jgi:hypothetical protein